MRGSTLLAGALVAALALGTAGCAGSDDRYELTIVMDENGWTASGGSVDAGIMCPGGSEHGTGYLELDGSPLAPAEAFERLIDGLFDDPLDEVADFLGVTELTCADGSGSFTMVGEDRNGGPWSVDEGTGAYNDLRGSGTMEIERRPADDPDGPPGGVPFRTQFDGAIEIVD